ncbi:hypothetical protein WMY93_007980 [Mugilogobius chulae]|uniref:HSF-type DNA-binding domain-containing protein n=1 Tax=Mugilogobius chulae TaxID=88201 RepID=A0AAW0PQH1_9GOBI
MSEVKTKPVDYILPETINPTNFPAKLWRMVNNPANNAICWDFTGEGIVIDQQLFEKLVLSGSCKDDEDNYFKTTHFSSFVRQLNLYGFRKSETLSSSSPFQILKSPEKQHTIHYFFNPNFRRDNPALLVHLKRLTVDNKAKMNRGTDAECQLPQKSLKDSIEDYSSEKPWSKGPFSYSRECKSPYPYSKLSRTPHSGTPIPPRHLPQSHIVPSLGHPYSSMLPTALQQGARYPLGSDGSSSCNKTEDENTRDNVNVNLDRVFQMADEVMLSQPKNSLTKTEALSFFPAQTNQGVAPLIKRAVSASGHHR